MRLSKTILLILTSLAMVGIASATTIIPPSTLPDKEKQEKQERPEPPTTVPDPVPPPEFNLKPQDCEFDGCRWVHSCTPPFPEDAKRDRVSGYVTMQYTIETDGRTSSISVIESFPNGYFEEFGKAIAECTRYGEIPEKRTVRRTWQLNYNND